MADLATINPKVFVKPMGQDSMGLYNYKFYSPGETTEVSTTIDLDPQEMQAAVGNPTDENYQSVVEFLGKFRGPGEDRGTYAETIAPALGKAVFGVGGMPVELANMAITAGVDLPINFARWAARGFSGTMPTDRFASTDRPLLGVENITRNVEKAGQSALKYLEEVTGAGAALGRNYPGTKSFLGGAESFDLTPDESTRARQIISLIAQITAAAPIEGMGIAKIATRLAKINPENLTLKKVTDAIADFQVKYPRKAMGVETGIGLLAGSGMVISEEALKLAWPNAPPWVKQMVMAGSGIAAPAAILKAGSLLGQVPVIKQVGKQAKGLVSVLYPERQAAYALQQGLDKSNILNVKELLLLAQSEGRNIDPDSKIALTLTEMAVNEASILRAQLDDPEIKLSKEQRESAEKNLKDLTQYAQFQDSQLRTIFGDEETAVQIYGQIADNIINRADGINAAVRKVLEAEDSFDVETGLGATKVKLDEALKDLETVHSKATEEALEQAQNLIQTIKDNIPEDATAADRANFDRWIRGTLENAYKEVDNYESLIWNNLPGMKTPKATTTKDGAPDAEITINGLPIAQYYADRIKNLEAGTSQDQTAVLYQLAGRSAILDNSDDPNVGNITSRLERNQNKASQLDAEAEALSQVPGPLITSGPTKPTGVVSLFDVIQSMKGINVDAAAKEGIRGELDVIKNWHINQNTGKAKPFKTRLVTDNPKGTNLDGLIERLKELGFENINNQNDLLAAINKEAAGDKVYTADDSVKVSEFKDAQRDTDLVIEEAQNRGIIKNTDDINPSTGKKWRINELQAAVEKDIAIEDQLLNPKTRNLEDIDKESIEIRESIDKDARRLANIATKDAKNITDVEGNVVDIAGELTQIGELSAKGTASEPIGKTAQEVNNVISVLKTQLRGEQGKTTRNPKKIANISRMISELENAIVENFPGINQEMLDTARGLTKFKKSVFETGPVGKIRGYTATGEPRVELEAIETAILRAGTTGKVIDSQKQATDLRDIEAATTKIYTDGDGGKEGLAINRDKDNNAVINKNANWEVLSKKPPPPFEEITIDGSGRPLGFKIAEGTPVNPDTIRIVEGTLWRRFMSYYDSSTGQLNTPAAQKWIDNNQAAIDWLAKAKGEDSPFKNLQVAESQAQALTNLKLRNLEKTIKDLRDRGAFTEDFTENMLREAFKANEQRTSANEAAKIILEGQPNLVGETLVKKFLDPNNKNPRQDLQEILTVLEKGALADGTNPALDGFKNAVTEALFKTLVTGKNTKGGTSSVKKIAGQLEKTTAGEVTLFDGPKAATAFEDPRMQELLTQLYGKDALPLLQKYAEGAKTVALTSEGKPIPLKDMASEEIIGNLGRIAGLYVAKSGVINPLIAAGVGRRLGVQISRELKGKHAEQLIARALLDPELAFTLMAKFPQLNKAQKAKVTKELEAVLGTNQYNRSRFDKAPGALYEVLTTPPSEEIEEEVIEEISMAPLPSRVQQVAKIEVPRPRPGTLLEKISPLNVASAPVPTAPDTQVRGQQVFGAVDPIFAKHGGLVSLCPPKRKQTVA
tara:strand:+ start:255 stop:4910 length:4656 start_codon:yes stop_codon:yes gene_type:complete